jgi:hypothetical protein
VEVQVEDRFLVGGEPEEIIWASRAARNLRWWSWASR